MRAALAVIGALAAVPAQGQPALQFPLDCTLGESCYIQQYVDRDPGPGARDFTGGPLSYDGHTGTDIAVPTLREMEAGTDVLAAFPGVVRGIRDGEPDMFYSDEIADAVAGRECGNGVAIVHEDGWETQYCHMKRGSVRVRTGDRVAAGTVLGQVGLSGKTQFPHLEISVRKDGRTLDPFDAGDDSLWADMPAYVPGALIEIGFAEDIPAYEQVQAGAAAASGLRPDAGAMVVFGYAYGGRKGDVVRIAIDGPDGPIGQGDAILERNQARYFRAWGKRRTTAAWPAGRYVGSVTVLRDGLPISGKRVEIAVE